MNSGDAAKNSSDVTTESPVSPEQGLVANGLITPTLANQVWDILVREAGANDGVEREAFVHHAIGQRYVQEYRFRGLLGFGGKVFLREQDTGWRVYYYPEDRNPHREDICERTNAALQTLNVPAN